MEVCENILWNLFFLQVNAGPLAYAQAFLMKEKIMKFPLDKTDTLKAIFKYVEKYCFPLQLPTFCVL